MFKNTASQKITVYVFDSTTNLPKTGDAANLTAYRSLDDGTVTVLADTSATELDSTNAKGFYVFDTTQGETNGDKNLYTCKSSTANMVCLAMPAVIYTVPANFATMKVDVDTIKTNPVVNAGTLTFPTGATLASTTNLTGGVITTVTNVTNAPISGDFTATMKTSGATFVGTALATFFTSSAALVTAIWAATTRTLSAFAFTPSLDPAYDAAKTAATQNSVDLVKVDTAAILVDTGTTLDGRLPAALTAGGLMKSDVLAVSGDTAAADTLEALMDGSIVAQVNDAGGTITTFIADGFTEATDDHFKGRLITFLTGALAGQQTSISAYTGATQTFTVVALTDAPANNDFFVIH